MNVLFVNYGDYTTNSLNHIGGFAGWLVTQGHACAVAVPSGPDTLSFVHEPKFIAATYDEVLANPRLFPDGRAADVIHAWTPREGVRRFVLAHQRLARARLVVHLEDNEEHLIEAFGGKPFAELSELPEQEYPFPMVDGLPHPVRHRHLLRLADGVTHIVDRLTEFIPPGTARQLLPPGVDFDLYSPQPPDPKLRAELGLRDGEKILVFTGSVTFANAGEMRTLYEAVRLLNERGTPTRLIRTGLTLPDFSATLGFDPAPYVIELGFVAKAQLPRLLALADVLVQPGRSGPFNDYRLPSKLPEFLATGRPVVLPAANIGLRITDGREALVLHEGSAREIATACLRVFAEPALAESVGRAGAAFARRQFDLGTNAQTLLSFYERVAALPPATAIWDELDRAHESDLPVQITRLREILAAKPAAIPATAIVARLDDLRRAARQLDHDLRVRSGTVADLRRHAADLEAARQILKEDIALVRAHAEEHAGRLEAENRRVQSQAASDLATVRKHAAEHARQLEAENRRVQNQAASDLATVREHAAEHARQLEAEVLRLQAEVFRLQAEVLRLQAEVQAEVQAASDGARRQAEEDEQRFGRLTQAAEQALARLQSKLHESEHRVQRMNRSFSWRATAWLRALRRRFLDPHRPPAAAPPAPAPLKLTQNAAGEYTFLPPSPPIRFHLDAPRNWPQSAADLVVRGWVVVEETTRTVRGVRARIGTRLYPGHHGLPRADVGNCFPQWAGANHSGFKISLALAETDTHVLLEVLDADDHWRLFHTQPLGLPGEAIRGSYSHWVATQDTLTAETLQALPAAAAGWSRHPVISLLMPVYNTPERWLVRAIDSVLAQTYPHWELCIADDASTAPHVADVLDRYAGSDPRIRIVWRATNGHISAASNSALDLCTGEFAGLFDHDDELAPHALHCIAEVARAHPEARVIYTDEDKLDENGARFDPHFKPDWNPELLTSQNYLSHLTVYRTTTIRAAGGFRRGFEGAQDWDLALRVTETVPAGAIRHIPRVLYHWRAIDGSTAMQLDDKDYAAKAGRRALEEHFARRQEKVTLAATAGRHWHVSRPRPSPAPLVTLVIPTRNRRDLLTVCVESIRAKTAYPNFEFLVADNDSDDPEMPAFYRRMQAAGRFEVLPCPGPFNYSVINNRAVAQARGELVCLLNNDLEATHPEWLDEMVGHALRPEIGAVGAKLYYPDGRIQHAGVITGLGGVAGHPFKGFTRTEPGTAQFRPHVVQNLTAVTAACLLIRKATFIEVGGLDEAGLGVAFNDVDFCLKVQTAGYRNVFTPFAELIHHESASRGAEDTPEKIRRFQREIEMIRSRWGERLLNDPAYNPNLSLDSEDFALSYPPRVPPLVEPPAAST